MQRITAKSFCLADPGVCHLRINHMGFRTGLRVIFRTYADGVTNDYLDNRGK